jgi:crooked neck
MQWEPEEAAWSAYINMEKRHHEFDNARRLFERFTTVHPLPKNWLKWAKFEEEFGTSDLVRDVFGHAVETLGDEFMDEQLFLEYARFEARLREYERSRAIYRFALDRMPRSKSVTLHKAFVKFEKQQGDKEGIEDIVLSKRRVHYEEQVSQNSKNYDAWLSWAKLEEASNSDRATDIYERAIANIPPTQDKRHWRRYIFLFLFYASYLELKGEDERARQVYQEAIRLLPHKRFTSAKLWVQFALFEVRHNNLSSARKLLGQAIGRCPKDKLYQCYIELELKLYEFGRCRQLYEKWIEWNPTNCQTYVKFAELEIGLGDLDRARAIYEIAVDEPQLDMPEILWRSYIDVEESEGEYDRARALYERLLQKTDHVKVWTSWAQMELGVPDEDTNGTATTDNDEDRPVSEAAKSRARTIFIRAHDRMKERDAKEDRVALLTAWRSFEAIHGTAEDQEKIEKQMPRKVKKRRKLDDGEFEEYIDYVFPADDESAAKMAKLLANAQRWKAMQAAQEAEVGGENGA